MNSFQKVQQFFEHLSDPTRLSIVLNLLKEAKTVTQIHEKLGKKTLTLSAISHQLRQLYDTKIVEFKKKGREKYFYLSDEFCWCILHDALAHYEGKTKCKVCKQEVNQRRNSL